MSTDFKFTVNDLMSTTPDSFTREHNKNLTDGKLLQTSKSFKVTGEFNPTVGASLLTAGEVMMGPGLFMNQKTVLSNSISQLDPQATTLPDGTKNPLIEAVNGSTTGTTDAAGTGTTSSSDANNAAKIQVVISAAQSQLGVPYVWGGETEKSNGVIGGFDCSGLIKWCFAKVNVTLAHLAQTQIDTTKVDGTYADLIPGDLIGYSGSTPPSATSIDHIALYVGWGTQIAAPHTGGFVEYEPVDTATLVAIGRPLPVPPPGGNADNSTAAANDPATQAAAAAAAAAAAH